MHIQQDGSLLEIKNAASDDFGTYECVAKNDEGESVGQLTFVARGSPVEDNQPIYRPQQPEDPHRNDPREPVDQVIVFLF